jgi:outer membrane protein TolC
LIEVETFIRDSPENNVRLLQSASSVQISEYDIKTSRALLLPRIGLTGSYGWNRQNNPASAFFPATVRTSNSLQLGANLTWDLFDGGASINNVRNAKLALETEELQKKQIEQEVERDLANARGNYVNTLDVFELQKQNVLTNQNNFERSREQFKLGQISGIEFRQAQINLLNAETQRNLAKYDAKLAEYQLLQITGQLLNVNL